MNDRNQDLTRFSFICSLLFCILHRNKTCDPFLFQKLTNHLFVSVKGSNHRPKLFFFLHILSFLWQITLHQKYYNILTIKDIGSLTPPPES